MKFKNLKEQFTLWLQKYCVFHANSDEKLEISSKVFFVFFCYMVLIWLCEVVDLFAFLTGLKQVTIFSRIVVGIIFCGILFFLRKKLTFKDTEIDVVFVLGTTLIIIFAFYKCVIPDWSYDTGNYHLIAQEPGFVNYFTQHFGLGNFQIWGFRLPDRMFYLFRKCFGYRMGTFLNPIILVISYFQIIQILGLIRVQLGKSKNLVVDELYALLIVLGEKELMTFGTYMVDIIMFPLGLEVLYCLLKVRENKFNTIQTIYFALLNGFWFACKMTNIVFIVPAILIFIFLQRKIELKVYIFCALCCIIPCSVYLIYNYSCTQNPIFPYFNKFFKSSYYPLIDFKDIRWGPVDTPFYKHWKQSLFWIFYAVLHPDYRQSEIYCQYTIFYAFGVLSAFVLAVLQVTKFCLTRIKIATNFISKKTYIHIHIILWLFASSLLWSLSTGYERYFMFGLVLACIIGYEMLLLIPNCKFLKSFLFAVFACATFYNAHNVFYGREWAWRNSDPKSSNFKKNIEYIFEDKEYEGNFDTSKIDAFFFSHNWFGGYIHFIKKDAYKVNLGYINSVSEDIKEATLEKMEWYLENKNVYDIIGLNYNESEYNNWLDSFGLRAIEKTPVKTNIGDFIFVKLGKNMCNINSTTQIYLSGDYWNAFDYITEGISGNETNGTWTHGNELKFYPMKFAKHTFQNVYKKSVFLNCVFNESQRIIVYENDKEVYTTTITNENIIEFPIIPDKNGIVRISISLPDATSPKEIGTGEDLRILSLFIKNIIIETE